MGDCRATPSLPSLHQHLLSLRRYLLFGPLGIAELSDS